MNYVTPRSHVAIFKLGLIYKLTIKIISDTITAKFWLPKFFDGDVVQFIFNFLKNLIFLEFGASSIAYVD
jgi:hypothetical protein